MLHRGIKPASAACWSDALSTKLHPYLLPRMTFQDKCYCKEAIIPCPLQSYVTFLPSQHFDSNYHFSKWLLCLQLTSTSYDFILLPCEAWGQSLFLTVFNDARNSNSPKDTLQHSFVILGHLCIARRSLLRTFLTYSKPCFVLKAREWEFFFKSPKCN